MEIRIDTKRDSAEEIKNAIEFLQKFIGSNNSVVKSDDQDFSMPSGMFDVPTKTEEERKDDEFKILEY